MTHCLLPPGGSPILSLNSLGLRSLKCVNSRALDILGRSQYKGSGLSLQKADRMSKSSIHWFWEPRPGIMHTRLEIWEGRLGREAVESLERGKKLFNMAHLVVVILTVLYVASVFAQLPVSGAAYLGLACLVWFPAVGRSMYLLKRMESLVRQKYRITGRFRPPLSFRRLQTPEAFDEWLLCQHRIPTPGTEIPR